MWPARIHRPRPSIRGLRRTLGAATAIVWAAGRRRLAVVAALQASAALLLPAQVLLGNAALQAVLDVDRGTATLRDAVLPLVGLAAAGAISSLTVPVLAQQQRLLGDLVQRAIAGQIIDVTDSVGLVTFEDPDFADRLQRVQGSSLLRPLLVTQGLVQLAGGVAGILGLVFALVALEPLLVPLLLSAGVPLLLLGRRGSAMEFAFAVDQTPSVRLRHYLAALLTRREEAKEVRAFSAQRFLRTRYNALWDSYVAALQVLVRRRLLLALVSGVVVTATTAGTLVVLVVLVVEDRIALAEAGAAAIAVRLLSGRLEATFAALTRLFESALFLDDLHEFLMLRGTTRSTSASAEAPPQFDVLEAHDLRFRYPSGAGDVLHGVDLVLRRGEVVALVGENGSGKTTLVKLLAGLYAPTAGRLTWNGLDVTSLDPAVVRSRVAVVFQDFVRYALSARENISLGYREEPEAVIRSARHAHAHSALAKLPDGYETVLSTEYAGGMELSGGQWQRVALARALHRDASLVLLDEPSAALDPRAEQRLFEAVRGVLADRAVVLVSHRFSTVRSADRILVMAEGRIVEEGSHDELMDLGGLYADLYSLQASGYRDVR